MHIPTYANFLDQHQILDLPQIIYRAKNFRTHVTHSIHATHVLTHPRIRAIYHESG